MKALHLTLVFLSLSCSNFAQTLGELSGNIQQTSGESLPFANVLLLNAKDSSLVKGTISKENGDFLFEKTKFGTYLVMTSMVGYQKKYSPVFTLSAENAAVKLGILKVEPNSNQLNEVTVATKRPFIEQAIDRTIVNVANSIVGSGSTALEVLNKAPGITIDYIGEQIELRGKQGVMIQIDGKMSYLSSQEVMLMLRNMPSDNIDRIEIITNPSAKYDASGNSGIINIVLKKDSSMGTKGSLAAAVGAGVYDKERLSLQLNHRNKKWTFFSNYSFNRTNNFFDLRYDNDQPDGNQRNLLHSETYYKLSDLSHIAKLGANFDISKTASIGAAWTGMWNVHTEGGNNDFYSKRTVSSPVFLQVNTHKTIDEPSNNQSFNLNYLKKMSKNQGLFSMDADAAVFRKDYSTTLFSKAVILTNESMRPVEVLNSVMPTDINIYTFKADYSQNLSKIWRLENGVKIAKVNTQNDIDTKKGAANNLILDTKYSNDFSYKENVFAAYAMTSGKIKDLDVKVGLRAEYTDSEGKSIDLNQTNKRQYLNWFPSLFISKPLAKKQSLTFSYSHRIDRPNYKIMNPTRGYLSLNSFYEGNIYLKPQYTHAIELKYAFPTGFFMSLGANFIQDLAMSVNTMSDGNVLIRRSTNMEHAKGLTLVVAKPLSISKFWQMQTNFMAFYNQYNYTYDSKSYQTENFAARLNINNGFSLKKGWSAELNGWVSSPRYNFIVKIPTLYNIDAGVQKSINDKMKLKLNIQNIFNAKLWSESITTNDIAHSSILRMDTRVAMLSFNYIFGNQKAKEFKQRSSSEDESRRAN